MEIRNPPVKTEASKACEKEAADEKKLIDLYHELTGASEAQARNVFMYSEIIRERNPSCYHLE